MSGVVSAVWFCNGVSDSVYIHIIHIWIRTIKQYNIRLAMININKFREATLIVKSNLMNQTHPTSDVVSDDVLWCRFWFGGYSYSIYSNKNKTTLKHKVSIDKTELKYGGNNCCKSGINESNTPTLCWWCWLCSIFCAVSGSMDIVWQKIVPLNFYP